MNILSTDAMVPLANANNIITGTTEKFMIMFDGTMPTIEQFKEDMYTAVSGQGFMHPGIRGLYRLDMLKAWAEQKHGATTRAWCLYPSTLTPHHIGPTKFRFPLSERPEEFEKFSTGTVTWFMFGVVNTNATTLLSSSPVYFVSIGSIGAEGSGADMILKDGTITADALRANDIVFNYTAGTPV